MYPVPKLLCAILLGMSGPLKEQNTVECFDCLFFIYRTLKTKWQEKSELIGKLEKEVVEMRNNFKEKEKTLTDERDKAIQAAK